ncbi:MAG TPA: efflux RND transporter periplasmic adaptor subunit [Steroidobacteraceae bacterium]|jgi:cobalt-zinc-cadmium efflux system membrane fusion protein|nr:efflux RND transporter periplasmic adaptor subunit [Steroidobacteraceae bacterium]
MPIHDHEPSFGGRAFLWGGLALGLVFLAALLTHGFGMFGGRGRSEEPPALMVRRGDEIVVPEGSALRKALTVEPVAARPVNAKLALPAVVESDPARTAAVLTPLAGRLVALKVSLGDRVKKGQLLALIDSPDFGQAYDDDAKAADSLKLADKNLERQQGQHDIGASSERDLDQAKSDRAQALAEYTRTQARLRTLGTSAGKSPLLAVAAPMSGSVTALSVAPGDMINDPTQTLLTIANLSTVWVTALVPEKDVRNVYKGQRAEVALSAYPDQVLEGKVLFVSDVIEPDSRRNKIRIAFANESYALKPNMFATVTLSGPPKAEIVVPSSALLMNNDRTSVFVATAPWTFQRRTVDADLDGGSTVGIRSGLAAGDRVVVKGGILLND